MSALAKLKPAPAHKPQPKPPSARPQRLHRERDQSTGQTRSLTRTEVRDRLYASKAFGKFPRAWSPDVNRICAGTGQRAIIDAIFWHTYGKYGRPEYSACLTAFDISAESGLSEREISDQLPDLIARGVLRRKCGCAAEAKCAAIDHYRYQLLPKSWPKIERPFQYRGGGKPCASEVESADTGEDKGEEEANAHGNAMPPKVFDPVEVPAGCTLKVLETAHGAKAIVQNAFDVRVRVESRIARGNIHLKLLPAAKPEPAADLVLDLQQALPGTGKPDLYRDHPDADRVLKALNAMVAPLPLTHRQACDTLRQLTCTADFFLTIADQAAHRAARKRPPQQSLSAGLLPHLVKEANEKGARLKPQPAPAPPPVDPLENLLTTLDLLDTISPTSLDYQACVEHRDRVQREDPALYQRAVASRRRR